VPRHRPIDREEPGEVIRSMKVTMRRDADGNLVPVVPEKRTLETTEAKPDPRDAPDPRSGPMRDVPPYGAGL
jgi:hypothetical protein